MKKAFTLIELLIVIAILGILGLGILIALDPIEQTRRATDSTVQQSAIEIKDAINRFYAANLYFPWCDSNSPAGGCTYTGDSGTGSCFDEQYYALDSGCGSEILGVLTSTGELKANPPPNIIPVLNIIPSSGGVSYAVGFNPSSKSFDSNINYLYENVDPRCSLAGDATSCPGPTNDCDYCIR